MAKVNYSYQKKQKELERKKRQLEKQKQKLAKKQLTAQGEPATDSAQDASAL